jgi:hypothetical protein
VIVAVRPVRRLGRLKISSEMLQILIGINVIIIILIVVVPTVRTTAGAGLLVVLQRGLWIRIHSHLHDTQFVATQTAGGCSIASSTILS